MIMTVYSDSSLAQKGLYFENGRLGNFHVNYHVTRKSDWAQILAQRVQRVEPSIVLCVHRAGLSC